MSNTSDFVIRNGVLKKYKGPGGDVVVPDGVTRIGGSAFWGCESLKSISLRSGLISIGDYAFSWCKSLKSITLPEGVTSIGGLAFSGCKSLEGIILPDGVTSIGKEAFQYCSSLTSITLPDSIEKIGKGAFWCCGDFSIQASERVMALVTRGDFIIKKGVLKEYNGPGGDVVVPAGVTRIGNEAFRGCTSLTSITLPAGVTSIGDGAFGGCKSLKSITLPEGLTSIGDWAFRWCESLTSLALPDGMTSIGDRAFGDCRSLKSITLPEGVTSIGERAFSNCKSLTSLALPTGGMKAKLTKDVFGYIAKLPAGLVEHIDTLYPYIADGALKQYVLVQTVWNKLTFELQTEIFFNRQGKPLMDAYKQCIDAEQLEPLGKAVLARLQGEKPTVKDCGAAAFYMVLFHDKAPAELLQQLYQQLKDCKNSTRAVEKVEEHVALMQILGKEVAVDESLSPTAQKAIEYLLAEKMNGKDLEARLKEYYSLTFKDLPELKSADGETLEPVVLGYLLICHEQLQKHSWGGMSVIADYQKPDLSPEAASIVAVADQNSLQGAIMQLAKANLGLTGSSKKMFLAYPICRYANEATMAELTKWAPKWASSVSGSYAPPLLSFRKAAKYSNTRAAMLFADRYHELDKYAQLRGMDEDTLRDQYLSDVGLDKDRGKAYDLGNQVVMARLQRDLSFLVELPGGKTAKTLPKKGADPDKYEAANKEFSDLKKNVKGILKNRGRVLFEDFLSGKRRPGEDWKSSYLENPLLYDAASLVVWAQGKSTFTLTEEGAIDSQGKPYSITDKPIKVAHPHGNERKRHRGLAEVFHLSRAKAAICADVGTGAAGRGNQGGPLQGLHDPVLSVQKYGKAWHHLGDISAIVLEAHVYTKL